MANVPSCTDHRVPLEGQPDRSCAERRISGSSSTATSDLLEQKLVSNKENACQRQEGNTTSRGVPEPRQTPTANSPERLCLPFVSALPRQSQSIEFRRPRLSCVGDIDDAITKKRIDIKLHDISQSRWIEDPNDHSMEKVYLTIESSDLEQMVTIDTSFCWTHAKRSQQAIEFEDFARILDRSPGLCEFEHCVAARCLDEVKQKRRVFANGKYFVPMVHSVREEFKVCGQATEVKATFVNMPMFSSMFSQDPALRRSRHSGWLRQAYSGFYESLRGLTRQKERSKNRQRHLGSRELLSKTGHPIRSLMQCANILAIDSSRDLQQAIIRLQDSDDEHPSFIHVPEFWALLINNTIITCAPFAVEQLLAENIVLLSPPPQDQRKLVKYTNLNGALHEFRCRTWLGLVDTISRIEKHVDHAEALSVLLENDESEYKLIDAKFRQIDKTRWLALTATDSPTPRSISLRLVRVSKQENLNVPYSERKLRALLRLTWQVVVLKLVVEQTELCLQGMPHDPSTKQERSHIETRLLYLRSEHRELKRRQVSQRFGLLAVRYHLTVPYGLHFIGIRGNVMNTWSQAPPTQPPVECRHGSEIQFPYSTRAAKEMHRTNSKDSLSPSLAQENVARHHGTLPAQFISDQLQTPQRPAEKVPDHNSDASRIQRPQRSQFSPEESADVTRSRSTAERVAFQRLSNDSRRSALPHGTCRSHAPKSELRAQSTTLDRTTLPVLALGSSSSFGTASLADQESGENSTGSERVYGPPKEHISKETAAPGSAINASFTAPPGVASNDATQINAGQRKGVVAPPTRRERARFREDDGRRTANILLPNETAVSASPHSGLTYSRLSQYRKSKDMKLLQPFLQWRTAATTFQSTLRGPNQENSNVERKLANISASAQIDPEKTAEDTLDILNLEMISGYLVSENFPIQPQHYRKVKEQSVSNVTMLLDEQFHKIRHRSKFKHRSEAQMFWETKFNILSRVDAILRCFVGNSALPVTLVGKVWGVVFEICQLPLEDTRRTSALRPQCNLKPLTWAAQRLEGVENTCRDALISARSDTGNVVEQPDLPLPGSFISLFRDIVLFLLSIPLVVGDRDKYISAADRCYLAVEDDLSECRTALYRTAREQELREDQTDFMHESLRTVDTLLLLLLENGFTLSRPDKQNGNLGPTYCDLHNVYWRWTAVCHERANREPSARMYEPVFRLRQELKIITAILEDQLVVYDNLVRIQQGPAQRLDVRIIKRTQLYLGDMITHFKTLTSYAEEAETLTTNNIRVSNEGDSKALLLLTVLTSIFLPMSAISSILGMNVVDIRNTRQSSVLFWAVALPVTFAAISVFLLYLIWRKLRSRSQRRQIF